MTNEELLKKIEEAKASRATELNLSGEDITALPPELFQLTGLTALNLRYNRLDKLPPEICQLINLTELYLSGNRLTFLPPEICQLTQLKRLGLAGTPIISPPPEIAHKGIKAIQEYFTALEEQEQPLNEVKIIIVGEGAAGKTSLIKQLLGEVFDKDEDTTHGISIRGWQPDTGGKQIKVNLWDFGG